jgi:hypothetical protein
MSPALSDRIGILDTLTLLQGAHEAHSGQMCVMEAVAYVAGENWSDHPACACPVIAAFLRSWNDSLRSDEERGRLLKPLVLQLIDTRSTQAVEEKRSYLAIDWMIRVFTPKWLDLIPSLSAHSAALRTLEEIADMAGAVAAGERTRAAGDAAQDAAWAAAGAAAQDAAQDAAWAVAGRAAWDAARAAAGDAARAAAWAAAGAAAWAAAGDAAEDAAWAAAEDAAWAAAGRAAGRAAQAALKPTTEWLQASALDLVARMIRVSQ